jgi:hypothetical protein
MKTLIFLLLLLLPQSGEPWKHQLDLEPMRHDAESLKKLTIMYDSPLQQGFELLFIRGDGSLILQRYPGRPMATTDLPTCKEKVGQDQVRQLVSLIVSRHFWELPEKNFLFVGGEPSHKELEVHRIFISNGTEKAGRVFAVGTYAGKQEAIPNDFAMIEQQFKQLAQSTFAGKPCHVAPAVQF